MATQETKQLDSIIASRRALLMGGGALAAMALTTGTAKAAIPTAPTDTDILNFALNLEYLEAQFYTLATEGTYADKAASSKITIGAGTSTTGSSTNTPGTSTTVTVKPTSTGTVPTGGVIAPVPFVNASIAAYAYETALEERKHVILLKSALSTAAVAQPVIDLYNSFNALGSLIGVGNFDPFANDLNFLLGAYIFEDVGVSAYHGGAPLLTNATNLLNAAEIHAVEAYHAGLVRSTIYGFDMGFVTITGETRKGQASGLATMISQKRATLDGTITGTPDDIGLGTKQVALNGSSATYTASTIQNVDANYLSWARTPAQVLNIVYATPGSGTTQPTKGGFFPNGLNGNIS